MYFSGKTAPGDNNRHDCPSTFFLTAAFHVFILCATVIAVDGFYCISSNGFGQHGQMTVSEKKGSSPFFW
jgi:hypothetical protein